MEQQNKMPLVSIIMNCYNCEKYLYRSLNSILAQTYSNWELIFWDNASTDGSKEILDSYNEPRFKYFRSKENVSLGQARAWAVEVCSGDYIAFLDVDDEWHPTKTEIQVNEMLKDNYVLSVTGVLEVNEDNPSQQREFIVPKTSGYIFEEELRQFDINMPVAMVKRDALIEKNLNFDPLVRASEEYCLFMQLMYGEKVCIIKDILAKYYIRGNSLTNKCIDRWYIERYHTLECITKSHPEAESKFKDGFRIARARGAYYHARYYMSIGEKKKARRELKNILSVDKKYVILFMLTFLPVFVWNKVHEIKNMR